MKTIYLDYAAATPVDPAVVAAMQPYVREAFYNPSALYQRARQVRAAVEDARQRVAQVLGARPAEIIFTAGATEANNIALGSVLQEHAGQRLLVSAVEHASVLELAAQQKAATVVPVGPDGRVAVEQLRTYITDDTVLISIMYANNEVGTIQPIKDIGVLVREVRRRRQQTGNTLPLFFHTDATQAANYLDLHVARLGVDFMTLNGGKIYGPKQTGVLYARAGVPLRPLVHGGGQEHGVRSGTENVPGIIGFARALELVQDSRHEEARRLGELQRQFIAQLQEQVPGAAVNGSLAHRLPNNVHITIPGEDNERLIMALDEEGVMAAAGSACMASDDAPSHVLCAMGISDADARSSLRFTIGRGMAASDITRTVQILAQLVGRS